MVIFTCFRIFKDGNRRERARQTGKTVGASVRRGIIDIRGGIALRHDKGYRLRCSF